MDSLLDNDTKQLPRIPTYVTHSSLQKSGLVQPETNLSPPSIPWNSPFTTVPWFPDVKGCFTIH
ncbi:hypothetical protein CEXT_589831, partial [Caerostris extrusa]